VDKQSYDIVAGPEPEVVGLPGILICKCIVCGGYRLRAQCIGACLSKCVFPVKGAITAEDIITRSGRVSRCSSCKKHYVIKDKNQFQCCGSGPCIREYYLHNGCSTRCEVCGLPCDVQKFINDSLLPHLYPERLFCGNPHIVCPGKCLFVARQRAHSLLVQEAKDLLKTGGYSEDIAESLQIFVNGSEFF
jgi:hypothetical protein